MERDSTSSERKELLECEKIAQEMKRIEAIIKRESEREEERRRGEEQRRAWERQHADDLKKF